MSHALMGAGMLATPLRAELRTPWPWLGAAVALLLVSPNLVWQAEHDWATLEFVRAMGETVLADIPVHYATDKGDYAPRNYDDRFHGPVRLRVALGSSYNIPAIRAANFVGVPRLLDRLRHVGFSSLDKPARYYGLGLTLGNHSTARISFSRPDPLCCAAIQNSSSGPGSCRSRRCRCCSAWRYCCCSRSGSFAGSCWHHDGSAKPPVAIARPARERS